MPTEIYMQKYLFRVSKVIDIDGSLEFQDENPIFELEIKANTNSDAIQKGLVEFQSVFSNENMDHIYCGAITWND